MASVDMAPFCAVCHVHHWPDTRHYGRLRRAVVRAGQAVKWRAAYAFLWLWDQLRRR